MNPTYTKGSRTIGLSDTRQSLYGSIVANMPQNSPDHILTKQTILPLTDDKDL